MFAGFAKDVARVVSAFDVSVFPSLWEGTPLTVFEALAMGKPIVATDADGLVDVLTHDRDALIVPRRDTPALAAAIVRLIDDPALGGRLSAAARETGRQYDIAAFVRPFMAEVFPQIADAKIDYGWGGAVAVTMNRLPHIGRRGSMFFAHGFSGHGALVTTLAGELIAEAMAGTAERFDVLAELPAQPFPGGKWLRRPLATLGLIYYALKDRIG